MAPETSPRSPASSSSTDSSHADSAPADSSHTDSSHDTSHAGSSLTADVVVLGGGPVGENLAQYAIEGTDLTAVIVESALLGGECSYYACMPSKALLRPIAVAESAAHLPGLTTPRIERDELLARRDDWVSHYDDSGQVQWAEGVGLQVVRGHGRIVGEREVLVEGAGGGAPLRIRARHAVVVATGSEAVVPEPLRVLAPWTSRDATGVREVPGELVIVGGGVVAVEAATWMSALDAQVTMLVRGSSLLSGLEPFAGEHVLESLRERGVTVELGATVVSGRREGVREGVPEGAGGDAGEGVRGTGAHSATCFGRIHGGRVTLQVEDARGRREVTADEVLAATGRRPALADVGLETIGLTAEDITAAGGGGRGGGGGAGRGGGGDRESPALPTWLHAVGDASGEAPLTHWGKYRARVIGQAIRAGATGEPLEPVPEQVPVPQVVFTDPQVTAVGLTEAAAREAGIDAVTARIPFGGAAGSALLRDDVSGTAQLVVDRASRTLVGASFVGPDASELLHAATIAIVAGVPVHVLRHAVPSYPTASELWLRLLEELPVELRRG